MCYLFYRRTPPSLKPYCDAIIDHVYLLLVYGAQSVAIFYSNNMKQTGTKLSDYPQKATLEALVYLL